MARKCLVCGQSEEKCPSHNKDSLYKAIKKLHTTIAERDEEILGLEVELATEQALHARASDTIGLLSNRLEEAEIKESTAALEIILLKNKLQAVEQKVASMQAVADAVKAIECGLAETCPDGCEHEWISDEIL